MVTTDFTAPSSADVESERLRALHRYAILDTAPDAAFDRIARVAARSLDKPMATITFVDEHRIWFKATYGVEGLTEIPREAGGLSSLAIGDSRTYVVRDTATDPYVSRNPSVAGEFGIRFYAAAPVTTDDGHQLGTVSVLDSEPGDVTDDQLATLEDLAAIVMKALELRLSALTTVRAERELRDTAQQYASVLQRACCRRRCR